MKTPHLLNQLKTYMLAHPDAIDLCFVEDTQYFPFDWTQSVMEHFHLFAKTGTGAYIGYWSAHDPIKDCSSLPLVWIDHEGAPMSVFANTTSDFLALLHFDTALIYDFLITSYFLDTERESDQNPTKKFTQPYLRKLLKNIEKENTPTFVDFRKWLSTTLHIHTPTAPAALIQQAINRHQNFNNWLTMNL